MWLYNCQHASLIFVWAPMGCTWIPFFAHGRSAWECSRYILVMLKPSGSIPLLVDYWSYLMPLLMRHERRGEMMLLGNLANVGLCDRRCYIWKTLNPNPLRSKADTTIRVWSASVGVMVARWCTSLSLVSHCIFRCVTGEERLSCTSTYDINLIFNPRLPGHARGTLHTQEQEQEEVTQYVAIHSSRRRCRRRLPQLPYRISIWLCYEDEIDEWI